MSPEDNKAVIKRFVEALNNGNYDLLNELMTPDFVRHSQATPGVQIRSREDFKRFAEQYRVVFPDQRVTNDTLVAEGDRVAFYGKYAGTQKGQMGPFPASNKYMEVEQSGVFLLENGKIAELWITWDNVAALTQLGHFPSP